MSSHRSPSEVRSSLKHPIIDGDGHWVEYNPVFAERMRKLAGDKAADGFIQSQRRIPDAFDFAAIAHLRAEAREKLSRVRPVSLAQASRISGITPADVALLMIHLGGK